MIDNKEVIDTGWAESFNMMKRYSRIETHIQKLFLQDFQFIYN